MTGASSCKNGNMEFSSLIQTFGTGAVVIVLISILISEIRSNRKLMASLEANLEDHEKKIDRLEEQISWIRDNYTKAEDCYRQMEGWRREAGEIKTSVNRIEERIYQLTGGQR